MQTPELRWAGKSNRIERSERPLIKLWRNWGGICYWCDCATYVYPILSEGGGSPPANQATRDHLRDRFNKRRREPVRGSHDLRVVLACNSCNHERGVKSDESHRLEMKARRFRNKKIIDRIEQFLPRLPPVIDDPRDQQHA